MVAIVSTVAFLGLEARAIEVQVHLAAGLPAFVMVDPRNNDARRPHGSDHLCPILVCGAEKG